LCAISSNDTSNDTKVLALFSGGEEDSAGVDGTEMVNGGEHRSNSF